MEINIDTGFISSYPHTNIFGDYNNEEDEKSINEQIEETIEEPDEEPDITLMNSVNKNLICPITHQIFSEPVMAEDGNVYEKEAIEKWFVTRSTSPMTREKISKTLFPVRAFIEIIEDVITKNPDLKSQRYTSFKDQLDTINVNPSVLLYYDAEKLCDLITHLYELPDEKRLNILKKFTIHDPIMKYIINTLEKDYEFHVGNKIRYLIHIVTMYCSQGVIKYMIDTGANLNVRTNNNISPIHYICAHSTVDILEYICSKQADIHVKTDTGNHPLHFAAVRSQPEFVEILLRHGSDINMQNSEGLTPLHIACQQSSIDTVKFIIQNGADTRLKIQGGKL